HIATLTDGRYAAGNHEMIWDGKDKTGKTAPTGVYFCRLTTPGTSVTRKILRL
ncbi:MAG: hypothetical protein FJ042_01710, partial [Candidatus Cloacimonetes bacterium]|nr:hypothetical protein [Candidatus Cloacimonadota bacterium]